MSENQEPYIIQDRPLCRRCNVPMQKGKALEPAYYCSDEGTCCEANALEARLMDCWKCPLCGRSLSLSGTHDPPHDAQGFDKRHPAESRTMAQMCEALAEAKQKTEEAQEEAETAKAMLADAIAAEREAQDQIAELRGDYFECRIGLEGAWDSLRKYGHHTDICEWYIPEVGQCTCGWSEQEALLKEGAEG
jgi:hypothetical protein